VIRHTSSASTSLAVDTSRKRRTTLAFAWVCTLGATGPKRPAAGQRHRHQQLVGNDKRLPNDGDGLRKCLARFFLEWGELKGRLART